MRHDVLHGTGTWRAEALDTASGPLAIVALAGLMALVAGVIGWAAGTFETVTILAGCAVLSALVALAVRGVLQWGVEPIGADVETPLPVDDASRFRRAA